MISSHGPAYPEDGMPKGRYLKHLGRRTRWDKGDWLPVVAPTMEREPAHRAFPKLIEKWDIDRIKADFADAAERMKAAGFDGIDFESFGHLLSQF